MSKAGAYCLLLLATVCGILSGAKSQSIAGVINSYQKVTAINTLTNTLTVTATGGFSPGSKILIIQMKGATINSTNTSSFGNIAAINNTGNYEINEICGITGNSITLKYQLLRSYDVASLVQIVSVPVYSSVTITDTLKAADWNPVTGTGGVLVMEATGTITMNSPIDASGKGFIGGSLNNYSGCVWSTNVTQYSLSVSPADPNTNGARKGEGIADFIASSEYGRGKQANGGGGGNNHNTGGGGGSNIGTGGQGGNRSGETFFQCHGTNPGIGGLGIQSFGYTVSNNRIFMGGGGGAGHQNNGVATAGGNGGGIILVKANSIVGTNAKFLANGAAPYNAACSNPFQAEGDGGGGGGGGGTILLDVQNFSGSFIAEAKGADGSVSGNATNNCTGPGGGGGGGIVWVSGAVVPGNLTTTLNGGLAGFISLVNSGGCGGQNNGATAGTAGTTLTGYVQPVANSFVCAPLASKYLKSFMGSVQNGNAQLQWEVINKELISSISLEKSSAAFSFATISDFPAGNRTFVEPITENTSAYYRLKLKLANGQEEFSSQLLIDGRKIKNEELITFFPNPSNQKAWLRIKAKNSGWVAIILYNSLGEQIAQTTKLLQTGQNALEFDFSGYTPGIYILQIQFAGIKSTKKIIVQR